MIPATFTFGQLMILRSIMQGQEPHATSSQMARLQALGLVDVRAHRSNQRGKPTPIYVLTEQGKEVIQECQSMIK